MKFPPPPEISRGLQIAQDFFSFFSFLQSFLFAWKRATVIMFYASFIDPILKKFEPRPGHIWVTVERSVSILWKVWVDGWRLFGAKFKMFVVEKCWSWARRRKTEHIFLMSRAALRKNRETNVVCAGAVQFADNVLTFKVSGTQGPTNTHIFYAEFGIIFS